MESFKIREYYREANMEKQQQNTEIVHAEFNKKYKELLVKCKALENENRIHQIKSPPRKNIFHQRFDEQNSIDL